MAKLKRLIPALIVLSGISFIISVGFYIYAPSSQEIVEACPICPAFHTVTVHDYTNAWIAFIVCLLLVLIITILTTLQAAKKRK